MSAGLLASRGAVSLTFGFPIASTKEFSEKRKDPVMVKMSDPKKKFKERKKDVKVAFPPWSKCMVQKGMRGRTRNMLVGQKARN